MKLSVRLKREHLFLLGCALLATIIRLFALSYEYVITPDGVVYAGLGRQLASGHFHQGLSAYYPPLYPLLVGLSSLVFADLEFAGRFVSVLAGGLLILPVYFLARNFYGKKVAVLAACLTVVSPVMIYYSTLLLTESTYTLLFTTVVLVGWYALTQSSPSLFFLTGLTLGMCYLIRPEAFGFIFLFVVVLLIAARLNSRAEQPRGALRNLAALLIGFTLLASPYIIYLHNQTGRWMISEKMSVHLLRYAQAEPSTTQAPLAISPPGASQAEAPPVASTSILTKIIVNATKTLRSEYEIFNLIFPPLFVLLTGVGLFSAKWSRTRLAQEFYLASFMIVSCIGYALTVVDIRYLVPLLPLLICWVANGIAEFEKWFAQTASEIRGKERSGRSSGWMVGATLILLSVILLLPLFVYLNRGDKWDDYLGQKRAGAWIKAHAQGPPRVMAENPITSFYAGGEHVQLPNEEYQTVIAKAREQKVEFLVICTRNLINTRLKPLLDGQNIPPEIKPVFQHGDENFRVVVYQLRADARGAATPVD